jgi:ABC-2 type transport system permease protein
LAADVPGRIGRVRRAVRAEILKASRQPALLVYLAIVVLVTAAWGPIQYSGEKEQEREKEKPRVTHTFGEEAPAPPEPEEPAEARGANGFFVLGASMRAGVTVAALLLLLYSATLLAGEGTAGTYRMVLVRPVTRTDLVIAKALLLLVLVLAFLAAIAATAWLLGLLVGGYGDYVHVRYGQVAYTASELAESALLSLALAPLALLAVCAFGLFCSSIFTNSATAVTFATLAGVGAVALNLGLGKEAQLLNFVTHVDRYLAAFQSRALGISTVFGSRIVLPGLVVPLVSALVLLAAARTIFARKDIDT